MTCDSVLKLIPLYYYGELTPDDEDQLDQHLHECAACTAQMEQQRKLANAFDEQRVELPASLLDECREDLMAAIAGGAPRHIKPAKGPWGLFLDAMASTFAGFGRLRQPIGAVALVMLGYVVARFSGAGGPAVIPVAENDIYPSVRSVRQEADGSVRIQLDETRRREITGRINDQNIQKIILAGLRDKDPAVRVESAGLLKNTADSQVLESLINTLETDDNDGVRLKALDALKTEAGDPRVIKAAAHVLLTDTNPSVRYQVIDLMVSHRDDTTVGVLQNVMQREDNNGVRLKASKVLKDWNASIGTF